MTEVFYEKSEKYPGQSVRVVDAEGVVWIGTDHDDDKPVYGANLPDGQAVRLATAILKAAGVDNADQAPVAQEAKPERVRYVNSDGMAVAKRVGQMADVLERSVGEVRLRFDDGHQFWADERNTVSAPAWGGVQAYDYDPFETDPFVLEVNAVFEEAQSLLLKKHKDYGPTNISRSPGGPLNGLRVRMWDKIARLNNLIDSGAEPENESLRDTLQDLANYALIGILVLDGRWPNE